MNSALRSSTLIIVLIIVCACSEKKMANFALPESADKMIAGDSAKSWMLASRYNGGHRMNMGDCFLSYRIRYAANGNLKDNSGEHHNCGPTLNGLWKAFQNDHGSFIKWQSAQLPELLGTDEDYKYFRILNLTKDSMALQYTHKQYGNTERKIIDYLVPEGTQVPDRDFHNR